MTVVDPYTMGTATVRAERRDAIAVLRQMRAWLVVAAAAAAGCQAPTEPKDAMIRLVPAPALTCKPEPRYRWLDALGHPYSEAFRKAFLYKDAEVELRYDRAAPAFRGTLKARKLKPNFTYQIKLVGMPPSVWGEKGDAEGNRRIGDVGRWWRPGKEGGNAYFFDGDEDKGGMEGYLVFGYFVTDAEGKADVTFLADSSFHVLWKVSQWKPSAGDAPPTRHPIVAEAGRWGYDASFPPGELELYAEAQYDRPPIGQARLAPGRYRCFILLTEESFHDYYNELGGDWAAALAAIVEFTITPTAPPSGQ